MSDIEDITLVNKTHTLIDEYFDLQQKYEGVYGRAHTIVFMEIGSFYEAYATDNEGHDLQQLASKAGNTPGVNWTCTKRNKKIKEVSRKNPYLLGFNSNSKEIFTNFLVENKYIVVLFKQVGTKKQGIKMEREFEGIYGSGTYLDMHKTDTQYCCCIYLTKNAFIAMGISFIDVSTGKCTVHEACSNATDVYNAFDVIIGLISSYKPLEIFLCLDGLSKERSMIIDYLELNRFELHIYDDIRHTSGEIKKYFPDEFWKTNYQNSFLQKIFFNEKTNLSMLEVLGLERKTYAVISYIILANFIYTREPTLISQLKVPEIYDDEKYLVLGNDALGQLNILPNDSNKSLLDIIDKTTTVMGRRFLKKSLIQPLISKKELLTRYKYISILKKNSCALADIIKEYLKDIYDLERNHRRIQLGILTPVQFSKLYSSYLACDGIISTCIKSATLIEMIDETEHDYFNRLLLDCEQYDMVLMSQYTLSDITGTVFKKGFHPKIDKMQEDISNLNKQITDIVDYINKLISGEDATKMITLEYNTIDHHYIRVTKNRTTILKKNMVKNKLVDWDKICIKPISSKSSTNKLIIAEITEYSQQIITLQEELGKVVKETYLTSLHKLNDTFASCFNWIAQFIGLIDFLTSGAICAQEYNYTRPQIIESEKSLVRITGLRHAIVERLNERVDYVTNDIILEHGSITGMLVYGLNSSGKSTLQKAVGIIIIMAQIGYYVPATRFIYTPYTGLFARITGNDNIWKGLSTFDLEMCELNAIIQRCKGKANSTLVIGDEVCRGTEIASATAIVATTILQLNNYGCQFIFATHLHSIAKIPEIMNTVNIKVYHLHVKIIDNNLVYERILKEGSGPETYGLLVSKYRIKDSAFKEMAESIKKKIFNESESILPSKVSKYNKNVFIDVCQICNRRPLKTDMLEEYLDTHHINFQENCDCHGFINDKSHMHKNRASNLVILCKKCHQDTHHGKIIITGYLDTIIGPLINYKYN